LTAFSTNDLNYSSWDPILIQQKYNKEGEREGKMRTLNPSPPIMTFLPKNIMLLFFQFLPSLGTKP